MELQFIYFKKYKSIQNLGLNFSSRYRFEIRNNSLLFTRIENGLENLWGEHITNITSIIGDNGSGKSTILELIKILCATDPQNPIRDGDEKEPLQAIVILYDRKTDKLNFFKQNNINISVPESITEIALLDNQNPTNLPNTLLIYYSNFYEYKQEYIFDTLLDISTEKILDTTKFDLPEDEFDPDITSWELLKSQFRHSEIYRQIKLISNTKIRLPFNTPEKIDISIIDQATFFYPYLETKEDDDDNYDESLYIISEFIKEYDYSKFLVNKYDQSEDFFYTLLRVTLKNYIKEKMSETENGISTFKYKIPANDIANYITKIESTDLFERFISFFDSFHKTQSFFFEGYKLLVILQDIASFMKKNGTILNNLTSFIVLNEVNQFDFLRLINEYTNIRFYPDIIKFDWHDLSSGENAYLNIFSRLFDFKRPTENADSVILLLDEAELGFHPSVMLSMN